MAKKQIFTVQDYCNYLEKIAPLSLQENYDNAGLIIGTPAAKVTNALLTLDCTEAVVQEAITRKCELIIAHHPIIFGGLKKINQQHYVERVVTLAIKHDIAIYASHTNIDNALHGVNQKIAQLIGLQNKCILDPKPQQLFKLYTYVPIKQLEQVKSAIFNAGAGSIGNYSECGFTTEGVGSFMPNNDANPFAGTKNIRNEVEEIKLEVILPHFKKNTVLRALQHAHPYEKVAYEFIALENTQNEIGAGLIGDLPKALTQKALLTLLKEKMKAKGIRFTNSQHKKYKRIAVCGGAGSFLINKALTAGADAYITADVKYHEFFEADNKMSLIDIGHYESESHTPQLFYDILSKKFPTFALHLSKINTNPIKYF